MRDALEEVTVVIMGAAFLASAIVAIIAVIVDLWMRFG